MSILVTDTGFSPAGAAHDFIVLSEADVHTLALDVPANADPAQIPLSADLIRIDFPASADGRGFSIARILRLRGYTGRLRARGHVIADQYAMARRCGFDEVEISKEMAARQPAEQWQFRASWRAHDYQARMRAAP